MKLTFRKPVLSFIALMAIVCASCQSKPIRISIEKDAGPVILTAANELQKYLDEAYPKNRFELADSGSRREGIVLKVDPLLEPGEYVITNQDNKALVTGGSANGVLNGVYGLLKKLKFSFFISFDQKPQPGTFNYADWQLADQPLKNKRIIFNWHNFLSGCTGWDYTQWEQWIDNSSKIGFNTIMVHAYGNNPMFWYSHNGKDKEVGFLTTTQKGRDWGAQHVNNARSLIGGDLFPGYEFGSEAAKVPDDERIVASTGLMQQVFKHAATRGMGVCFALDVDTWMSNPQNIISTLPKGAILPIGGYHTVNPEHPDGRKYYETQLKNLFKNYPEITMLAAWMREPKNSPGLGSIWLLHDSNTLPEKWKAEYFELLKKNPGMKDERPNPGLFAISKIVKVYSELLTEIRPDVELVLGSWLLNYPTLADPFMPESCGFIPLDWSYVFNQPEVIEKLSKVGKHRKLYPIMWAHHDDHRYMGRPYIPFKNFNTLLDQSNAAGYGIIHWTTHPLDLLFNNYENQVWKNSENESYEKTSDDFANALMKKKDENLVRYYRQWYTSAPMFGRETTDFFMKLDDDFNFDGYQSSLEVVQKAKERLEILESVNLKTLNKHGLKEYRYQQGIEKFVISFFTNHHNGHSAFVLLKEGEPDKARSFIDQLNPRETIEIYAKTISDYGATKGEEGILVSLNLRWLPDYIDLQQRAGVEPVRINFQPTSHDPLAQAPGRYTFLFEENQHIWISLGEKELGTEGPTHPLTLSQGMSSPLKKVTDSWMIVSDHAVIPLRTMRGYQLPASDFELQMIFAPHHAGGKVEILEDEKVITSSIFKREISDFNLHFNSNGGKIQMRIIPDQGVVKLSGIVIDKVIKS